jgi:hypothetical protein
MCLRRNIEARLRKHCYHGKIIIVTYLEYVSVALVIQHRNSGRNMLLRTQSIKHVTNTVVLFVGYLYIMDLINALKTTYKNNI